MPLSPLLALDEGVEEEEAPARLNRAPTADSRSCDCVGCISQLPRIADSRGMVGECRPYLALTDISEAFTPSPVETVVANEVLL